MHKKINISPRTFKRISKIMKINVVAIQREIMKRALREKKKNLKPDNKKRSKSIKKYKDDYEY